MLPTPTCQHQRSAPQPSESQEATATPEVPAKPSAKPSKPGMRAPEPTSASTELTKVSIYLDEHADAFLESVRATARTAEPRVDATRSAVVRLALTRMAQQLSADEVVAQLHRRASDHRGPGRKRA